MSLLRHSASDYQQPSHEQSHVATSTQSVLIECLPNVTGQLKKLVRALRYAWSGRQEVQNLLSVPSVIEPTEFKPKENSVGGGFLNERVSVVNLHLLRNLSRVPGALRFPNCLLLFTCHCVSLSFAWGLYSERATDGSTL